MKKICEGKRVLLLENDGWEYVERKKAKEAVVVVAQTDDGRLILTEQMRRPVDAVVIDLPAGLIGDEDGSLDAKATARKELEEETGYTCERLELLARGPTSPGITSEIVSFFRAHGVRQIGPGGGVGKERIVVHGIRISEMRRFLESQEQQSKLIDLKIWSGLYFLGQST